MSEQKSKYGYTYGNKSFQEIENIFPNMFINVEEILVRLTESKINISTIWVTNLIFSEKMTGFGDDGELLQFNCSFETINSHTRRSVIIYIHLENGSGAIHRYNGCPAVQIFTGNYTPSYEEYWLNDTQKNLKNEFREVRNSEGIKTYKGCFLHGNEDDPAFISSNGDKCWYKFGWLHRDFRDSVTGEFLPAIEKADGTKQYYMNGIEYNSDGSLRNL